MIVYIHVISFDDFKMSAKHEINLARLFGQLLTDAWDNMNYIAALTDVASISCMLLPHYKRSEWCACSAEATVSSKKICNRP